MNEAVSTSRRDFPNGGNTPPPSSSENVFGTLGILTRGSQWSNGIFCETVLEDRVKARNNGLFIASTSMTFSTCHSSALRTNCPIWVGSGGQSRGRVPRRSLQVLGGLDHAEHVDHAGGVAEPVEVDQVDHAPDRTVCEREHIASHDRCRRMSDPEIAAVGALQSELDAHLHAASMPSTQAERSDPIVSYLAKTVSTTFVRVRPLETKGFC